MKENTKPEIDRTESEVNVEPLVIKKLAEQEIITAHSLAEVLMQCPDLPIAVHANNHTYNGACDRYSHGKLKIGLLHTYNGDHIIIGNISKKNINKPNWYVKKMIIGEAPEEWGQY